MMRCRCNSISISSIEIQMSEYQYYEFLAVDRRLDERQMEELRAYSSRARITPTSFTNEYSYGSFKGNADVWMEKYFDAHLYLANWGTHELQIRVPSSLLRMETVDRYCSGDRASAREKSGYLIFRFFSEDESGEECVEGDGLLSSILPVRDELIRGDLRALYLGWLLCAQGGELDDDDLEPPVPAELANLSGPLSSLADFLRLDPDLLVVAAEASAAQKSEPLDRAAMKKWVAALPVAEKDDLLLRIIEGKGAHLDAELFGRFKRCNEPAAVIGKKPRTVRELLTAAQNRETSN